MLNNTVEMVLGLANTWFSEKKATPETIREFINKAALMFADDEIDEQRLAQEVIIYVDKSDISEEIQRLGAHINAIKSLMNQKGSIGKKLDFYAQELLREVNTIGSKSSTAELTHVVVEAKGIVEKYREQVQNVE